jgi:hypothetical protein
MNIALLADRAMISDLGPLVDGLRASLEELHKAAVERGAGVASGAEEDRA